MSITAAQVKELRDKTGAGMMDAKKALEEAGGDMEKAIEVMRQKGIATAAKKSGRTAAEGLVSAAITNGGKAGALVEVNCETDFVAKGGPFGDFVEKVTQQVVKNAPDSVEAFLAQPSDDASGTMQDFLTEQIGSIKENMTIRRFVRYECAGTGLVFSYIHTGGKIGVLTELSCGNAATEGNETFKQLGKDICMQIASAAAEFVSKDDIPQSVIEEETRIEMGKDDLAGKPEEIRAKIVAGRVDKMLAQQVLLEQAFVKDPGKTIADLLKEISGSVGDTVSVKRFTRYQLGEGIEKVQSNFAEEVMAQLAK